MSEHCAFSVRPPTGTGWLTAAVACIVTGELLFERHKDANAVLFTIPFADSELLAMAAVSGLVALLAVAWLVWSYLRPGQLVLDADTVSRTRRRRLRQHTIAAPMSAWKVRVVYFSPRDQAQGTFKKLELSAPGLHEVLLFGDFDGGEKVAQQMRALAGRLGGYDAIVERQTPV